MPGRSAPEQPRSTLQEKYLKKSGPAAYLVRQFFASLDSLLAKAIAQSRQTHAYLEVGCGEGEIFRRMEERLRGAFDRCLGCDIDEGRLAVARASIDWAEFSDTSVYDITEAVGRADVLVCCEVLEHLHDPETALAVLTDVCTGYVVLSVPREPLWRALNMARFKYWSALGNTPGHLNHWSKRSFLAMISRRLEIVECRCPLPWTMVLARAK